MNHFSKQSSETFTVEQGYYIAMMFFFKLWRLLYPVLHPEPYTVETNTYKVYLNFLMYIPCNDRHCAEWNETVRRLTEVPREEQRTLSLTIPQIFKCAFEYCKLHHKHYNYGLPYIFNLLESMEKDPDNHQKEWQVWEKAIQYVKDFRMNRQTFDWEADPALPYE